MKNLFRKIISVTENTEDVLLEEEVLYMEKLQEVIQQVIPQIEEELNFEKIKIEEEAKAGMGYADRGKLEKIENLINLLESIMMSANHYINRTLYFESNQSSKPFSGSRSGAFADTIRKKRKFELSIVPSHEINYYLTNNLSKNLINILSNLDSFLDKEKIYIKLSGIDKDFSKKLMTLITVIKKLSTKGSP